MSKTSFQAPLQPPSSVTGELSQPAATPMLSHSGQLVLPQGQKVSILQGVPLGRFTMPSQVLIQVAESTAGTHQYAIRDPKTDEETVIINEMRVLRSEWSKSREEKEGQNSPKKKAKLTFLDLKLQAALRRLLAPRTPSSKTLLSKKRAKRLDKKRIINI